ncbi:hypothetical protein PR048_005272 [Dryococelus australis]|uniref:Uncharacterized protein n=1 Tax=Dryococelus australis TaxID=614101 RepID=A0ABQ9I7T9_9NEOP|nr:hypothetical protein PR048_005272 [Dryococelus australis]
MICENTNMLMLSRMVDMNLRHVYDDHVNVLTTRSHFKGMCSLCWQEKYGILMIIKDCPPHKGRTRDVDELQNKSLSALTTDESTTPATKKNNLDIDDTAESEYVHEYSIVDDYDYSVGSKDDDFLDISPTVPVSILGRISIWVPLECSHTSKMNCEYEGLPLTPTIIDLRPASSPTKVIFHCLSPTTEVGCNRFGARREKIEVDLMSKSNMERGVGQQAGRSVKMSEGGGGISKQKAAHEESSLGCQTIESRAICGVRLGNNKHGQLEHERWPAEQGRRDKVRGETSPGRCAPVGYTKEATRCPERSTSESCTTSESCERNRSSTQSMVSDKPSTSLTGHQTFKLLPSRARRRGNSAFSLSPSTLSI